MNVDGYSVAQKAVKLTRQSYDDLLWPVCHPTSTTETVLDDEVTGEHRRTHGRAAKQVPWRERVNSGGQQWQ